MIVTSCGGHPLSTQSRKHRSCCTEPTPSLRWEGEFAPRYVVSAVEEPTPAYRDRANECRESSSMLALQTQFWSLKGLRSMRERGHPSSTKFQTPILLQKPTESLQREGRFAPKYVVTAIEEPTPAYRDRARECRESPSMLALHTQLPVSERLQSTRERRTADLVGKNQCQAWGRREGSLPDTLSAPSRRTNASASRSSQRVQRKLVNAGSADAASRV